MYSMLYVCGRWRRQQAGRGTFRKNTSEDKQQGTKKGQTEGTKGHRKTETKGKGPQSEANGSGGATKQPGTLDGTAGLVPGAVKDLYRYCTMDGTVLATWFVLGTWFEDLSLSKTLSLRVRCCHRVRAGPCTVLIPLE